MPKRIAPVLIGILIGVACTLVGMAISNFLSPPIPHIFSDFTSRLTSRGFVEFSWSPDGSQLVALGVPYAPSIEADVFIVDAGSGRARKVSHTPGSYTLPSWSPDGSRIAMTVHANEIWLFDPISRRINYSTEGEAASWSGDGRTLAVWKGNLAESDPGQWQVRFVDPDVGILQTLALTGSADLGLGSPSPRQYPSGFSWSPDGTQIAVSLSSYEGPDRHVAYLIDAKTGQVQPFQPEESITHISFAPSGDVIAYIRQVGDSDEGELVLASRGGSCLYEPPLPPEVGAISWSADASAIAFRYYAAIHILDLQYFDASARSIDPLCD